MQRILIVEDESALAETLAVNLKAEGYRTIIASDGVSALDLAASERPDLVILDIMLPGLDGLEVCRALRKRTDIPIIMLTAKAREVDKVIGLEIGADDYITKPFSMLELIARVRAALRRHNKDIGKQEVIQSGDLTLDRASHTVTISSVDVDLRPKEFDLLTVLLENKGRALSREALLRQVWGEDEYIDHNTVDVHIRRLREKIEDDPSKPKRVLTIRGAGYKFAP
ncbi:MAG: response regulator transcription factor [Armatimonadota bacterium]|nr:response regulator transcription factor [Armatimonadota bacterium]